MFRRACERRPRTRRNTAYCGKPIDKYRRLRYRPGLGIYRAGKVGMVRRAVLAMGDDDLPPLPASDSVPGALDMLLEANRLLRQRRWPRPYDRTQHQLLLGDA